MPRCTATTSSPEEIPEGDSRRANPRFQGENFARNMAIAARLQKLAEAKGATAAQLGLAWVMARGEDVVPFPGTKRRAYPEENVASDAIELTDDDLRTLDEVAPAGVTAGERYADMSSIDV